MTYDGMLKFTRMKLELLSDYDMLLIVKNGKYYTFNYLSYDINNIHIVLGIRGGFFRQVHRPR